MRVLNIYEHLKFKSAITFSSEGCLGYIRKQNCGDVFLTLYIPLEFLYKWHQIKVLRKLPISYVELLYISQSVPACYLKEDATERVEKRLQELCSYAANSCTGIRSGYTRTKKLKEVKRLAIHRYEVKDLKELLSKNNHLEEEKAQLLEQIQTLEARCDDILTEVLKLKQDINYTAELEQSLKATKDENVELQAYIQTLVEREYCKHCTSSYANKGSTYDKVKYTQKQKKLKELKSYAERALWFMETFGLKLDSLTLTDSSRDKVTLKYNEAKKSAYKFLTEEDQDKIRNIVYIMDTYHEFSMIDQEGIPCSYLIKQCRQDLNQLWSISRTSGEWPGAQLSFKEELHYQLSKQVNICTTIFVYKIWTYTM